MPPGPPGGGDGGMGGMGGGYGDGMDMEQTGGLGMRSVTVK